VSPREAPRHLVVGQVKKAHGLRGEVSVRPLTDHPESTFAPGVVLYLGGTQGEVAGSADRVRIETARPFRRGFLVRFEGSGTRAAAEELRGVYLLRPFEELESPGEGEFFHHELVGLRVVTAAGEEVGEVVEVFESQPADLLEVRGSEGTFMMPFLEHMIVSVDLDAGVLTVDPPAGLFDL
jgi:16S rRNA processing protein RimM